MIANKYIKHYLILLSILYISLAVIGIVNNYSPVPFWDMWNGYLEFYTKVRHGDWYAWFAQHNEHRIVFSNVLFYLDICCFNGYSIFLMICNFILMSVLALLLINIINELFPYSEKKYNNIKYLLYFLSVIMMFSWLAEENIIWAFQSQFFAAYFFPLLSFYLLIKSSVYKSNNLFFLSVIAGVISVGTMANGILALPILLFISLFLRENIYKSITIFLVMTVVLYLYFYNYTSPAGHGSIGATLREHPKEFLEYLFAYLGGIFYYIGLKSKLIAQLMGVIFLGLSIFFTYLVFIKKGVNKSYLVLIAFLLFYGGTAFGTAGGRALFGIEQAFSGRYMTPSLISWNLLIIYSIHYFKDKISFKYLLIAMSLFTISLFTYQINALQDKSDILFEKKIAALSLEMGIRDEQYITKIFPFVDWIINIAKEPVKSNYSIFNHHDIRDVNLQIGNKVDNISKDNYIGYLDHVSYIKEDKSAFRVNGWIFDSQLKNIPNQLYIFNQEKKIIGYVITGQKRKDVQDAIDKKALFSGFVGYIKTDQKVTNKIYLMNLNVNKKLEINMENK